jgi:ATP-dependent exoDNAse (exonuclease V) beta subunit
MAELLADQHAQGHAWGDMAVLCRHHKEMDECSAALVRKGLPHRVRKRSGAYRPEEDAIKVMTMHASKGLEWPVVAVMAERGTDEAKGAESQDAILEARVVYVATARATQRLLVL